MTDPFERHSRSNPGAGGAYELLQRGLELLSRGDSAAAATVLERAVAMEPVSASVLETCARAQFDAGRYTDAASSFRALVDLSPDADYARFGLGLCLSRLDRLPEAVEQLRLAVAMRPDQPDYTQHLRQVQATVAARQGRLP